MDNSSPPSFRSDFYENPARGNLSGDYADWMRSSELQEQARQAKRGRARPRRWWHFWKRKGEQPAEGKP